MISERQPRSEYSRTFVSGPKSEASKAINITAVKKVYAVVNEQQRHQKQQ